jgi:hypothetical protein
MCVDIFTHIGSYSTICSKVNGNRGQSVKQNKLDTGNKNYMLFYVLLCEDNFKVD